MRWYDIQSTQYIRGIEQSLTKKICPSCNSQYFTQSTKLVLVKLILWVLNIIIANVALAAYLLKSFMPTLHCLHVQEKHVATLFGIYCTVVNGA